MISGKVLNYGSIIIGKIYSEDASNARVNDKIREQISAEDKLTETNLRKRKERAKKIFRLFNNIGRKEIIGRIKTFNATTILNLSQDDVDYIISKILETTHT